MAEDSTEKADALVVGAGPSGLFAAICLAERLRAQAGKGGEPPRVLVLEKREHPARKFLISGSGRCNLSHEGAPLDFLCRYGGGASRQAAGRFLKPSLLAFDNDALLSWFSERGVDFVLEESGKFFPRSGGALGLLEILVRECGRLGVVIRTGCRVVSAAKLLKEEAFRVETRRVETRRVDEELQCFQAPLLLISTGGASYPKTGSSGEGYALAASLGHAIVRPRPALTPVYVRDFRLAELSGLSFQGAGLRVYGAQGKKLETEGDLLITHEGFSGPLVLDASRHIDAGDRLEVNFLGRAAEEFRADLDEALAASPRAMVRSALAAAGLPRSLAEMLAGLAGLGDSETGASLRRERREALVRLACAFPATVEALGGFETAMATAGGVELSEIDPKTMESRIVPGLFFAGEVLDVDGGTGGYNLQAAFSTGFQAAAGMARRLGGVL